MHTLGGLIFMVRILVFETSLNIDSDITNFLAANPHMNEYFRHTVSSKI